jgi:DNA sulfur modification protein DndB
VKGNTNSKQIATPFEGKESSDSFSYVFSALKGIQAGREYFVGMCPLKLIPKIFLFDEDELPAELRAQRAINRSRVPEIARYLIENPNEYVFSSITASMDGEARFEPIGTKESLLGKLTIPMTAKFIINDGQHRRAAIEAAIKERPELGDETISVVFFQDGGLRRSQQMFADLNKHAVRPTKSIGILYDLRDPLSQLATKLSNSVPWFKGLTETQKTTISNRSLKLFTLSGIYQGTVALLNKSKKASVSAAEETLAQEFWTEIGKHISEWQLALDRKVSTAELRREFIHSHGLALHALGIAGCSLFSTEPKKWKERLKMLDTIEWSRSNSKLWEGRAMIGGRVSKAQTNVILTGAFIKKTLRLPLSPEEQRIEGKFGGRGA